MTPYFSFGALLGALFVLGGAFWLGIETARGNVDWENLPRSYWGGPPRPVPIYDGPNSAALIILMGPGIAVAWPAIIALAMGFGVVRLAHLVVKRDDNAPEA